MTYKNRMKVAVSNAEIDIQIELTRRGLDKTMWMQKEICLYSCRPDFYFDNLRLCVFIDGFPHTRKGALERDSRIDDLLRKRKFKVARFSYKGKLSQERLKEIVDEIERLMKT